MKTALVSGGNSGIGRQVAQELLDHGYRVAILGRDKRKGQDAIASFGAAAKYAELLAVDLSTHAGVREAAKQVRTRYDRLDAVVHTTGVLTLQDVRTTDGLSLFFAVNYLSRYHLTQLLLPALLRSKHPRVIMMTAKIDLNTRIDFERFPEFKNFNFSKMRQEIQIANHYYAAYLKTTEPRLLAGVVNAGSAKTDILRLFPWYMRAVAKFVGPLVFNSVEESAHNVVQASLRDDWATATYWDKPGKFEEQTPIQLSDDLTRRVMRISEETTHASALNQS